MIRLRTITERDRLAEASTKLEAGEPVDWGLLTRLQTLDLAVAGRAALNDALDCHEEADGNLQGICGG